MKRIASLLTILVLLNLLACIYFPASAVFEDVGLKSQDLSRDQQEAIWRNLTLSPLDSEVQALPIACFDVQNSGRIALGFGGSTEKYVCIYGPDGEFQHGYSFTCNGSFGVRWEQDNLILYLVRSSTQVLISPEGEFLGAAKFADSADTSVYLNQIVFATERTVGEKTYTLRSNWGVFASSYSRLLAIDDSGNEQILYDSSANERINGILILSAAAAFVLFTVLTLRKVIRQSAGRH